MWESISHQHFRKLWLLTTIAYADSYSFQYHNECFSFADLSHCSIRGLNRRLRQENSEA